MLTNKLAVRRVLSRVALGLHQLGRRDPAHPAVVESGFLFEQAPFRECHAATIAATDTGLVAAWFGGSGEGRPDTSIWIARNLGSGWSPPVLVADGERRGHGRVPAWNPVLFQPRGGPLQLHYKLGPDPHHWHGRIRESTDGGRSWGTPRALPEHIYGPIKNKPLQLADGTILCPSSEERDGWRVHVETSHDDGRNWRRTAAIDDAGGIRAIQPSILQHADGRLQLLCRSKQRRIASSWSSDRGEQWTPLELLDLPNPNSGTDALTLTDGRQLLIHNPSTRNRQPLALAWSDDGLRWRPAGIIDAGIGEYSYPAAIQDSAGRLHIVYTWNLIRIRHLVLDPAHL